MTPSRSAMALPGHASVVAHHREDQLPSGVVPDPALIGLSCLVQRQDRFDIAHYGLERRCARPACGKGREAHAIPRNGRLKSLSPGFTIVLAGLKALLEHGIELNLVRDQFPDAAKRVNG